MPLPLEIVALLPPAMNHILVSVALRHRMYRVGANSGRRNRAVLEMRSKYYHHRGMAISAMNREIRKPDTGNVFLLIVSAIMFVFAEVSRAPPDAGQLGRSGNANIRHSSSSPTSRAGNTTWTP